MQKITFRKLIGENYIYPELQGHFIEFLVLVFTMASGSVRIRRFRIIMESAKILWMRFKSCIRR